MAKHRDVHLKGHYLISYYRISSESLSIHICNGYHAIRKLFQTSHNRGISGNKAPSEPIPCNERGGWASIRDTGPEVLTQLLPRLGSGRTTLRSTLEKLFCIILKMANEKGADALRSV